MGNIIPLKAAAHSGFWRCGKEKIYEGWELIIPENKKVKFSGMPIRGMLDLNEAIQQLLKTWIVIENLFSPSLFYFIAEMRWRLYLATISETQNQRL